MLAFGLLAGGGFARGGVAIGGHMVGQYIGNSSRRIRSSSWFGRLIHTWVTGYSMSSFSLEVSTPGVGIFDYCSSKYRKGGNSMKHGRYFWGLLLVIIGVLWLVNDFIIKYFVFTPGNIWPFYLLIVGLFFEFIYFFTHGNPRLVIPGSVLITAGIISFVQVFFLQGRYDKYVWPVYFLVPLMGHLQFYYASGKDKRQLTHVYILTGIACVSAVISLHSLFHTQLTSVIPGVIFILGGLVLLFKQRKD